MTNTIKNYIKQTRTKNVRQGQKKLIKPKIEKQSEIKNV